MNLPLINNDNVGNSYYGWRTDNLTYAPDSVGFTPTQCANWINEFFGQTCAFVNATQTQFSLILPSGFESLTLPASESKYRFNSAGISATNADPSTTTASNVQYCQVNCANMFQLFQPLQAHFAVLNSQSLNIFMIDPNNVIRSYFFSCGWLKNSLYSGSAFVRNAYFFWIVNNQNDHDVGAGRPFIENSGTIQNFVVTDRTTVNPLVNYPVSCQIATPDANATEFYLRDNVAPNKAVGYPPNILKSSLNIPIGQVYRNTGVDPDGSSNPYWLCVGRMGNQSILMRVWAQGLL